MRNSGLMSVFVEADIIISICNFDQSTASSPLTPQRGCDVGSVDRVYVYVVEMCSYNFICFHIGFTRSKTLTLPYCAAFRCKHDSAKYRELSFLISSGKIYSSDAMDSQLRAGWLEADAIC